MYRLPRGLRTLVPRSIRQSIRQRFGPFAPWERGFVADAPPAAPGMVTGPPSFVGIGAQKAGTSWWYELVVAHPAVHHQSGTHKERHFFARFAVEDFGRAEVEQYHRWFPRPAGAVTGEWTPDYLHQDWVPPLLAQAAPDARLLVIVRDPLERLVSGVAHEEITAASHLGSALTDAVQRGFYAAPLRNWARWFAPERILVLQYERCVADPSGQLARTFEFLGLDPPPSTPDLARRVSETTAARPKLGSDVRRRLVEIYAPDVAELAAAYPDLDLDLWPDFAGRERSVQP